MTVALRDHGLSTERQVIVGGGAGQRGQGAGGCEHGAGGGGGGRQPVDKELGIPPNTRVIH